MVPSSFMPALPQFSTAAYGMAAVLAWGSSDFFGGYATRRADAFVFTAVVNLGGLLLVGALAAASGAPSPAGIGTTPISPSRHRNQPTKHTLPGASQSLAERA